MGSAIGKFAFNIIRLICIKLGRTRVALPKQRREVRSGLPRAAAEQVIKTKSRRARRQEPSIVQMAKMTSSDLVDPAVSRLKQIGDLVRRTVNDLAGRSEERRVGKECRS